MGRERSRLVYSTGPEGRRGESPASCPRCGATPCCCPVVEPRPPAAHAVRVRIERSGRKGKTVTVCGPFYLEREEAARLLAGLKRELETLELFEEEAIEALYKSRAVSMELPNAAKLIHPTRLAVTGTPAGPGLFEVMVLLTRETVVRRMEKAIAYIESGKME